MDTHTYIPDTGEATAGDWGVRRAGLRLAASALLEDYKMKRGLVFGGILVAALAAFELFNFSTTEFALTDVLGSERFLGVQWATILALAFCGIDFAGLARLFTPPAPAVPRGYGTSARGGPGERGDGETVEVWYLLGAWFLGATLNAMATWWAVTLALLGHNIGNEVLSRDQIITFMPVLVAALVWLTRILIIGTFSVAGERLFSQRAPATLAASTKGNTGGLGAEQAVRQAQRPQPLATPAWPNAARVIGEKPAPQTAAASARPTHLQDDNASQTGRSASRSQPASPQPRIAHTRPAPKPPAAPKPLARFVGDDEPVEERWADDLPPFVRRATAGASRPANGVNGAKTIE